ncbi:3-carboxy-cis,cis-muconate cycloisomerase [Streptomyces violascens]|uniref:3-carboxy-cis,cis-muconate cycloisomerase n=1 Tax=Streptomyces violascens TaxID=67381 RepID=UPI0037B19952
MTSGEATSHGVGDAGLLTPVSAGSPAEAATGDGAVLRAMLDAEAALARAQAEAGGVPGRAAEAVTKAAGSGRFDARGLALRAGAGGNPVIPLVADLKAVVAELSPGDEEFVHRGATSQDILDTALMLVAARTLDLIGADLAATAASLATLAERHRATVMAARTLTQHAVPTTFGLKAAGWRSLILDAHDRAVRVRAALPVQLGGAAGTLAAFEAYGVEGERLVHAFAAELGLCAPELPWHALRTPVADLAGVLAFCAGALGKVAADVLVLSRTEVGEVAEGTGGVSSSMPHKSNPVRSVLLASAARQVPALVSTLYASMAAEDERPPGAWHAEWSPLREALRLCGGAARGAAVLCGELSVFPARMRSNAGALAGGVGALAGGVGAAERLVSRALRRRATPAGEGAAHPPTSDGR